MLEPLFNDVSGLQACKKTPAKVFFSEFCKVSKNSYFVEYLQTATSELVRYQVYIFFRLKSI